MADPVKSIYDLTHRLAMLRAGEHIDIDNATFWRLFGGGPDDDEARIAARDIATAEGCHIARKKKERVLRFFRPDHSNVSKETVRELLIQARTEALKANYAMAAYLIEVTIDSLSEEPDNVPAEKDDVPPYIM